MTHIHPEAELYEQHADELAQAADATKPRPIFSREWLCKFGDMDEPEGCAHCGAIAGTCSNYPHCPGGPEAQS